MMKSVSELQAAMDAGEFCAEELAVQTLSRIADTNDEWHIFTKTRDAGIVAEEARLSDERRRNSRLLSRLDGIPVAVKDNIDVAGMISHSGTRYDFGGVAERDAGAVARLRAAGAIVVGKLNMHEGALGATTDNPFWGRCENPTVPGHTPGGSSGGSGAAIAGNIVPITLGTDTMGSVRIPAAYCGTWGLKPSKGLIGNSGLHYLSWYLDTIGPLASNVDDLAATFQVLAGYDPDDPDSVLAPGNWNRHADTSLPLDGVVIGYVEAARLSNCEDAVLTAYESVLRKAELAGAKLRAITIEGWDPARARRHGLLISEAQGSSLLRDALTQRPDDFSEGFRSLLDYGRKASAERLAQSDWELRQLQLAFRYSMTGVDTLLLPTAPQRTFPHGTAAPANQADFTALANFVGSPSLAFPVAAEDGLAPASVQCVGLPFTEGKLLGISRGLSMYPYAPCGRAIKTYHHRPDQVRPVLFSCAMISNLSRMRTIHADQL